MSAQLIKKIRQSVIGENQLITTSFGAKPLVYADYTASGRGLSFIEDYIRDNVLPFYANTHTESSYTGAQTNKLREQARDVIHSAVNGDKDDAVIFCGAGATAAINKLIDILNLRLPADLTARYGLLDNIPEQQRPVVFIGPYEHHSNELPWRESIAIVERIALDEHGQIDLDDLDAKLQQHQGRELKIGSFSAASNVTGIKTDVDGVSALLHQYGALAFWDYAAAAPYVGIDMNPVIVASDCSKDAVFISPHKFIGGQGTPGVLVVKKHLLTNTVPSVVGGGTVSYVSPDSHSYVVDAVRREEGGTPAIVESIRAGLVFKLQQQVGTDLIEQKEHDFVSRALARWNDNENIEVLGDLSADRLSIVSMRIKHKGIDLHYGFVVALLNDLFGIQARGGCSCAGPYGHSLLNIDSELSNKLAAEIASGSMILRPGWTRLNFNYFISEETFDYIVSAIELVAEHGWKLLPYYSFNTASTTWSYQATAMQLVSDLSTIDFNADLKTVFVSYDDDLADYLATAERILNKPIEGITYPLNLSDNANVLRWFWLPQALTFMPL
jgi:selenocysteine lyase/cysteine desulfurase